ncbi:MAG TPA: FAD-dependent oxidoreductase, partial [Dehalococcoidia bacterium]|nr:FAD-dependent oxidoreductase [Dehalococcoidia bacterium]
VPADIAVLALGYVPDPLVKEALDGAQETDDGFLHADHGTGRTSIPGVFAGGDVVRGTGLVVTAMAAGRRIAAAIDAYLNSPEVDERKRRTLPEAPAKGTPSRRRGFGFRR